ncbi:MAG: flavodoxin-dependent (E)-4-hydroxy-3-methylbut-2-enyl-diphosphate synthase, partial [Crocinitomicaceae bacterium]|nr:flavodoxin-dependent (E)-4-hydroxy-3-methylbut-2-enyl-diphosphate synthase [Crocinitomicaceae bacterium]
DTPRGMVESAMEFVRICEENHFFDVIISMKASNVLVMVQAYRLLVHTMMENGMSYPLHLGVTEAGDGEDGRIKSAIGIGTLLEDGLGDTIRVSLTEEPEAEIPVARILAERYSNRKNSTPIGSVSAPVNPFEYTRRHTKAAGNVGGKNVPRVVLDYSEKKKISAASLFAGGYHYSVPLDKWNLSDQACDYVYCGSNEIDFDIPGTLGLIFDYDAWLQYKGHPQAFPMITAQNYLSISSKDLSQQINFISVSYDELSDVFIEKIQSDETAVLVLGTTHIHGMAEQRAAFFTLMNLGCDVPVIISRSYKENEEDRFILFSATDSGALLIDGLGDGIFISAPHIPLQRVNSAAFGILQATRTRISKTEYISCPSCGRTLFNLQETTANIRSRTSHLKGIKIGIMGCIVNGPGEMADADYGYVGTGPGKVTLYKEKHVVKKNISSENAVEELIELIRANGDWVEPGE